MKRPCSHIAPAISPLLEQGAEFAEVIPGGGEYKFVHRLTKGPSPILARQLAMATSIDYWVNNDPHYDMDCGFSCSKCCLAVAWRQKDGVINEI